MRIADSILRDRLSHVYWITGSACAGKTTVTGLLAEKHGFTIFPDRHADYQQAADFSEFPALRIPRPGTDWEWFFSRPVDEYVRWLEESVAADLEFAVVDLLSESTDKRILVDTVIDPLSLIKISAWDRVICMFGTEEMIRRELMHRDDHRNILDCIQTNTSDPAAMEENVVISAIEYSRRSRNNAVSVGAKIVERLSETTKADLFAEIERHFDLN